MEINYKKSLGQNFIFDKNLLKAIANDGEIKLADTVLEIGAGAGTLTSILAENSSKVISFEIDKSLVPILDEVKANHDNIEFHFEDFMQADLENIFSKKIKVIANIPYYITTPIIFKLVEQIQNLELILVLIQKEVAERFSSKEKCKDYGITSVILQSLFDVSITRIVKKECFTPNPKVDSAVCKLVPHNKYKFNNFDAFKDFVHSAFSMRRKTIVNNLKNHYEKEKLIETLNQFNYNPNTRPEEISVENFINIFNALN